MAERVPNDVRVPPTSRAKLQFKRWLISPPRPHGAVIGIVLAGRARVGGITDAIQPTESLVERFGLFVIIVLGEVILGVVAGLSAAEPDALAIVTGLLALVIGLSWIYFDLVGRRLPRSSRGTMAAWMLSHPPVALAITAAGAAIVSLVEHAHDPVRPPRPPGSCPARSPSASSP